MIRIVLRNIVYVILISFLVIGCNLFKGAGEEKAASPKEDKGDVVSPLSLAEDFEIIPEKYPITIAAVDTTNNNDMLNTGVDSTSPVSNSYETYRIQLFTSKTYGPAAKEQNIAVEVFDKDIYLDYEVPYYKVRIGDFATSDEAQAYLPAAVEAGYKNAWVVKVTVNIQKLEDLYDENIPPLIDPADTGAIIPEQIYESPQYPEN